MESQCCEIPVMDSKDPRVRCIRSLDEEIVWAIGKPIEVRIKSLTITKPKSLIALHAIKEAQSRGLASALIDAEHSFDAEFAKMCGIDPYADNLCIVQPDSGEQGLEALRRIVRSGVISLVILDSVAALSYKTEQEKEVGEATMALGARYLSTLLKELVGVAHKNQCTMIFVNQLRNTLKMYGQSEDTGGGFALKYYTSLHLRVTRQEIIKQGGEEVGIIANVKATKNKVGTPFKSGSIPIYFPHFDPTTDELTAGIDTVSDLMTVAIGLDVINKKGSWIEYKDIRAQGEPKFRTELIGRSDLIEQIKTEVRIKLEQN